MPLFDLNGKMQNPIGKKDYWSLFTSNQGSPAHQLLKEYADTHLQAETYIHSGQLGSQVLSEVEADLKEMATTIPDQLLGRFWGLVLWNAIALAEEDWTFSREQLANSEKSVTHYHRMQA